MARAICLFGPALIRLSPPGIVNDKAVDISEAEGGMAISAKRLKTAQKPNSAVNKAVSKKNARRAIAAVRKQVRRRVAARRVALPRDS